MESKYTQNPFENVDDLNLPIGQIELCDEEIGMIAGAIRRFNRSMIDCPSEPIICGDDLSTIYYPME